MYKAIIDAFIEKRIRGSSRTALADALGEPGENPGQGPLL